VGEKPSWLKNVEYRENKPEGCKARKIMENVKVLCEMSDEFIFVNDDYFFLRPLEIKYYHKGEIREHMEVVKTGDYYRHLLATDCALKKRGLNTLHFDVHYPIVYNSKELLKVIEMYDWDIPDAYVLKSLYCNTLGIEGEYREDCKVYKQEWKTWEGEMFSSSDSNFDKELQNFLLNLYPEQSFFE
jgi:hypothetical protein